MDLKISESLNGDIDPHAIDRAQSGYLAELGMRVTAWNINTWTHPKFGLGGPCNPDPALRRQALEEVWKGVEICKLMTIPVLSVWPGSDGARLSLPNRLQAIARVVHRGADHSMINFANLALKAVRIFADQPRLDRARQAGTGPDVLDVVSPVLVG